MTPEERSEFETHGILRLRELVDPSDVRGIADRAWELAEKREKVQRNDSTTWKRVPPAIMKQAKEEDGLFEPLLGPKVARVIDLLLGDGAWAQPRYSGQLLMTPPDSKEWKLPHGVWHLDSPAPPSFESMPGVQLFLLLEDIDAQSGATLVVSGSHRLVERLPERKDPTFSGSSADVRKALAQGVPWLRDLWRQGPNPERVARLMEQSTEFEGIPLQVRELAGKAGDLFVMHPWMLHAPSPHAGTRMRMMLVERLVAVAMARPGAWPG